MDNFPKIMGILNVTPDSFSDGGKYSDYESAIRQADSMIESGADIIDIGGESTRPGAEAVDAATEISRVVPVIRYIRARNADIQISIDTTKREVALDAIGAGANMINDISGLSFEPELASLAAKYDIPIVLMHMQGTPRTMQVNPRYHDVVEDVFTALREKIEFARRAGARQIYADVGIGFGKSVEHNLELLKYLKRFKKLGTGLLLGISRKSFIGKMLGIDNPEYRDLATTILHSFLLDAEIDIIRVHNVDFHVQLKKIFEIFKKN